MPASLHRVLGPWHPGDLDGFLALGLNNLIQILLIISLCRGVLGYPDALIFGQILPAAGVSLLVGNLAYSHLARRLGAREQRDDCTALPYRHQHRQPVRLHLPGDAAGEAGRAQRRNE